MLKHTATIILLFVITISSAGCAMLDGKSKASVDFSCVVQDERLGAPFTDPERARAWLLDTKEYLQKVAQAAKNKEYVPSAEDLARLADLADLVERATSCLDLE